MSDAPLRSREYHAPTSCAPASVGHSELLMRVGDLDPKTLAEAHELFPVQVTRSFFDRAAPTMDDPLLTQVLPDPDEVRQHPTDRPDPVGDFAKSPVPWVVSKHRDRVLLLVTKRCHLYCRYCFRRDHQPGSQWDPTPEELEAALEWCVHSGAREVVLSGGDPLAARRDRLLSIVDRLKEAGLRIRIHTRAPITAPDRVDSAVVLALGERTPLWMVVHANHVRELDSQVEGCLRRLREAGITLLNQSVLLRGVNDSADALVDLSDRLTDLGVKPYYLHLTDPVPGNARFRVGAEEALRLHDRLKARVSGIALPSLVVDLPDGSGKLPVSEAITHGLLG